MCQKKYCELKEIDMKTSQKSILLGKIPEVYFVHILKEIV